MPSSSFTPDLPGSLHGQLIVNDGTDSSVADSVTITVLTNEIALALVGAQVVGVTREAPIRVTLPFAAPSGGTTVTLTSAAPGFLSVVAPGTASSPPARRSDRSWSGVKARGPRSCAPTPRDMGRALFRCSVTHNLISSPSTLNVAFGGSTALPINIGPDPAPAGGLTLDVASSDADIEVLTPQVTVPAGALSVNATVRGARVGTANVTVGNPNYAPSTTVSRAARN